MLVTDKEKLLFYYTEKRMWQGIPSVEVTKSGRIFATFYSGNIKETFGNFCVLVKSNDGGKTFTEPVAAADAGKKARCFDSCLWIDPLGRLWFIWSAMPELMVYATICDNPDKETLSWREPFKIGYGIMMNKPTVASDGSWLFPIAVWKKESVALLGEEFDNKNIEERLAFVYKTADNGKSFVKTGGVDADERTFDEHMLLEKNDGSLKMFVRTSYGICESTSEDGGYTWTNGSNSKLISPNSRFFIRRLKSGRVLLISNNDSEERKNLTAFLSDDDCASWKWSICLDERNFVSYPDAAEGEDGYIYIVYDRERGSVCKSLEELLENNREILLAKISEEDIIAGKLVCPESREKIVISKLSGYNGDLVYLYENKGGGN
ncbi:MAG: exo-alpha-sialidase [Clostridia bacterium]|nr:exo-alpha-sialidase [Clostridia bacterium]